MDGAESCRADANPRWRSGTELRAIALLLTVLTGFSGLVYQVVWQKYLAVLLGSHSEATAAVLGIFLGGLALGYALFGRVSRVVMARAPQGRARARVVLAYGIVEAAIGVYAFGFSALFALAQTASLALSAPSAATAFGLDVALTALLLGPPTVLMGGTIPLLTQGLARDLGDATRFHAFVYAFNTTGAFVGALCAGFVLVPWLGLRDSVVAMGVVNTLAGVVFVWLASRVPADEAVTPVAASRSGAGEARISLAVVALLAGFAMMTLQTALNRIGALSLGASHFTFSMVVATFVLSIAIGSFAVSFLPRIGRRVLPASQWALVFCLLALYPAVEDAPYWAHRLRVLFGNDDAAFLPFHLTVFGALLAVAVVPLGLSGALLPLVFHELRRGADELGRVAGALYGWNTLGSLLGALVGGYALFFWLDLHQVYRVALVSLGAVAAILSVGRLARGPLVPALGFAALVLGTLALPAWSPERLSSGLFRIRETIGDGYAGADALFAAKREALGEDFVRFYRDDPIASIAVHETRGGNLAIVTNGKVDGNIPRDNQTQGLLALLPALLAERNERAFVVGWGTGMTAGELAALDDFQEVVVAEISPAVMEAAPHFELFTRGALGNPRTRVVRSDAYRTLQRSRGRFDVIVSEPSNPWVTGVEMLYTREFLSAARTRLAPGGVFAQWFHIYESDPETIGYVLRTYLDVFERVAVWHGETADLIVLGFADPNGGVDLARLEARIARPDFARQLEALGLERLPRLLAHELVPTGILTRSALPGPLHTLERPALSHTAARAFFRGSEGQVPVVPAGAGSEPALWRRYRERFPGGLPDADRLELLRETCRHSRSRCATLFAEWMHDDPASPALAESLARARRRPDLARVLDPARLSELAAFYEAAPAGPPLPALWRQHFHHTAPFKAQSERTSPPATLGSASRRPGAS